MTEENKCESHWQVQDELKLLNGILEGGFGNWTQVAKYVPPFTPKECEKRYWERFITEPDIPELASLSSVFTNFRHNNVNLCSNNCNMTHPAGCVIKLDSYSQISELEKSIRSLDSKDDPDDSSKSLLTRGIRVEDSEKRKNASRYIKRSSFGGQAAYCQFTCPGYNPFRSEFEIDYDDKAERILSVLAETTAEEDEITFASKDEEDLFTNLKVAVIQNYNFRLVERQRRKKIIRTHALLDRRKTLSMIQRYEHIFRKQTGMVLTKILQLVKCGPEMDLLLERLGYQFEVKARMNKLLEYRRDGVKSLSGAPLLEHLRARRLGSRRNLHSANLLQLCLDPNLRPQRRPAPPLALHNLPGYNLLEDDEKELCSVARIVPETYHSFKNLLIQECKRHDGLKLIQARSLIKIDVNKTRKIYDFLMARGLIWSPPAT